MSLGKRSLSLVAPVVLALLGLTRFQRHDVQAQGFRFQLEEATIADVHRAIREGQITCRGLVQAYLNRAKAYNGVSDRLVTRDGAPIPAAPGTVRAGSPLKFPTETVAISTLLPDGAENRILRVASAYEAASKRRVPPPAYPRLPPRS